MYHINRSGKDVEHYVLLLVLQVKNRLNRVECPEGPVLIIYHRHVPI